MRCVICCKIIVKFSSTPIIYKYPINNIQNRKIMITIRELCNKIQSWPNDTMNFRIEDVFAWRGYYVQPACYITCNEATKEHNLSMLASLTTDTFFGWKGGEYEYDASDELNFETDYGSYSNRHFILNFLVKHENEPIVKHIFDLK